MSNSEKFQIDLFSSDNCIYAIVKGERDGESFKEEYPLLCSFVSQLQLSRGFIDSQMLERICECSAITRAYLKACSLLSYGECSVEGLCRKLCERGYSSEIARRACALAVEKGLINERDAAVRMAESCLSKLWGERRIISKLREKGFRSDALEGVKELFEEQDFHQRCVVAAQKKLGKGVLSGKEYSKAYGMLARLGYTPSQINYALKTLSNGEFDEFSDDI